MSNPTPVYRLTDTAFRALVNEAKNRPELWQDPNTDFAKVLAENGITNYREPAGVTALEPISLEPPPENRRPLADRQALKFHQNLAGTDGGEGVGPQPIGVVEPLRPTRLRNQALGQGRRTACRRAHVRRHWLTELPNDIYEASIAGRTYWIAETCFKAALHAGGAFTAEQAIELLSERAERYHYSMRFSFMRNPLVTAEYIRALLNEAEGINRSGVMSMVRQINREAGAKLIDALGREQCRAMMVNAAGLAMTDEKNVTESKYLKGGKPLVCTELGRRQPSLP